MASRSISARARSQSFVSCVVVLGVGWMGCATNGDPAAGEPGTAPTTTSTSKPAPTRPDFEAGFPDDAGNPNADPTPDGGDTCIDKDDPGGAENVAKALPDTTDAQNTPITVKGIMNGPVDVDFYRLKVADTAGHFLQPDLQTPTSGIEMCVFVKCPSGPSNVTCSAPAVKKTSDIGTEGCCGSGPSSVTPGWNCSGLNDSAELFIRIKQTGDKCLPYSFSYAF
jgi:hypothetical protein